MTKISIKMQGLKELTAELQKLEKVGEAVTVEVITDLVTDTHAMAVAGIQAGQKLGRTYTRNGVTHTASAPGQYPASDTGVLAGRVGKEFPTPADMTGRVGTGAAYGPMLEFGTSHMAARPWLLPSFERAKIGVEKELRARLEAKL